MFWLNVSELSLEVKGVSKCFKEVNIDKVEITFYTPMQAHSNLQNAKMSIEEVMQYTAVVKRRSNYFFVQDF